MFCTSIFSDIILMYIFNSSLVVLNITKNYVRDFIAFSFNRLKIVEIALHQLTEATQTVSNIEVQLASCDKMSSNLEDLQKLHDNLLVS